MFDIAWSELGVIAVVALVVIGPKDLPKVLRSIGQWTAKARSMAREFQSGLDDMVREADLEDLRKAAKQVTDFSVEDEVKKTFDPDGSLERSLRETQTDLNATAGDLPPDSTAAPAPAPAEEQAQPVNADSLADAVAEVLPPPAPDKTGTAP